MTSGIGITARAYDKRGHKRTRCVAWCDCGWRSPTLTSIYRAGRWLSWHEHLAYGADKPHYRMTVGQRRRDKMGGPLP